MRDFTTPCPRCGGAGRISAGQHLIRTYQAIALMQPVSTADLLPVLQRQEPDLKIAALCNRMSQLCQMGWINRSDHAHPSGGLEYIYRVREEAS